MTATYENIATTTLGSATNTVSFTSIGSGYTDLRLVVNLLSAANHYIQLEYNSDSGTNYSETWIDGSGAAVATGRTNNANYISLSQRPTASGAVALFTIDIFSYAGSTNKTCLITSNQDNNGSGFVGREVGLWRSTSAITTVRIFSGAAAPFNTGSVFTLFGIKAE